MAVSDPVTTSSPLLPFCNASMVSPEVDTAVQRAVVDVQRQRDRAGVRIEIGQAGIGEGDDAARLARGALVEGERRAAEGADKAARIDAVAERFDGEAELPGRGLRHQRHALRPAVVDIGVGLAVGVAGDQRRIAGEDDVAPVRADHRPVAVRGALRLRAGEELAGDARCRSRPTRSRSGPRRCWRAWRAPGGNCPTSRLTAGPRPWLQSRRIAGRGSWCPSRSRSPGSRRR